MEIEIKLRLPNTTAHTKLATLLTPNHITTHHQLNHFFDGALSELSTERAVLRLRFYSNDRCVVSLKSKAILIDGVSRVQEDEEDLDIATALDCVKNPKTLINVENRVVKRAIEEFGIGENGFVGLGGFGNVRGVYQWNGLQLELDETDFGFGICYELECETENPEEAKVMLEEFLKENGIQYEYSKASKFAIFRAEKLL